VAERFREQYGLGEGPLGDLVGIVEETTGYDVAIVEAPSEKHGLTMTDPLRGVTFIAVAAMIALFGLWLMIPYH